MYRCSYEMHVRFHLAIDQQPDSVVILLLQVYAGLISNSGANFNVIEPPRKKLSLATAASQNPRFTDSESNR